MEENNVNDIVTHLSLNLITQLGSGSILKVSKMFGYFKHSFCFEGSKLFL